MSRKSKDIKIYESMNKAGVDKKYSTFEQNSLTGGWINVCHQKEWA